VNLGARASSSHGFALTLGTRASSPHGHTMIPPEARAPAHRRGRFGFAFGRRFFFLLALGMVWIGPAFAQPRFLYAMLAWDLLVLIAWAIDLAALPRPDGLVVTRRWAAPAALSVPSQLTLIVENDTDKTLLTNVTDDLPQELRSTIPMLTFTIGPHGEASAQYGICPARRGDIELGNAHIRYQSVYRLAERWAIAPLTQTVCAYPNLDEAKQHSIYLIRSRQIDVEKRYARVRGAGRDFESLREYRETDELRDVCWTASARRGKLVAKSYQIERSQTVWIVLDAGRLMRTRVGALSKLDYAANAALSLAQVALYSGDRVGLLTYGRGVQHRLPAARGRAHLLPLTQALADVHEEASEADHLLAASALLTIQKRRSLVVWLTDLAETAMTPEVVDAASQLMPPHLLLFVVIGQPDLTNLAASRPNATGEMYVTTAAHEMIYRRELLLARMRERGALALEVYSHMLSTALVNSYLDVKQRSKL